MSSVRLSVCELSCSFGRLRALDGVSLELQGEGVTAVLGASGSGKSTLLRAINRTNELLVGARTEGAVALDGVSVYERDADVRALRRRVVMVLPRPSVFAMSVIDNVAYGLRAAGVRSRSELVARVETALKRALLWNELREQLDADATRLPPGVRQRLCIARALCVDPRVLLLDEPTSALDPEDTARLEDLLAELRPTLAILIATRSSRRAARVSSRTVFLDGGRLVEQGETRALFTRPKEKRTEDYLTGRFG